MNHGTWSIASYLHIEKYILVHKHRLTSPPIAIIPIPIHDVQVLEGMDVVKAVEAVGSQSGATSKTVRIAKSGEITA